MALKKQQRMDGRMIAQTFLARRPVATTFFSLRATKAKAYKRVAITISAKVAPKAVLRNQARRQVVVVVQEIIPRLQEGCQVVIGIKKIPTPPRTQIKEELLFLFGKSGILNT